MGKVYVSWKFVENFVENVENLVRNKYPQCTGIYGLPRGGLCLAVMLSHKLSLPLLMSPVDKCLIVDDICDSGESLIHYAKNSSGPDLHNYVIATMFFKDNRLGVIPDYYEGIKKDDWIIFCWESTLEAAKTAFPDEEIVVL